MSDPDPVFLESAKALQRTYRMRRRRWAWAIHRPYSRDIGKPEPGSLDLADPTEG